MVETHTPRKRTSTSEFGIRDVFLNGGSDACRKREFLQQLLSGSRPIAEDEASGMGWEGREEKGRGSRWGNNNNKNLTNRIKTTNT